MERSRYCDICKETNCTKDGGQPDMGFLKPDCYKGGSETRIDECITIGELIGIVVMGNIDSVAMIMTDSGWECSETEVDLVYYNAKTKVLMLTRKYGNYDTYEESDDWKLVWRHPKIKIEGN